MNVLVVEDAVDIAALIELVLERAGHSVQTWTSAFTSIAALAPWSQIDVIVCDQELDDYDGKTLLHWLREEHPQVRRILLTGSSMVTPDEAAADLVLIKPVSQELVLASLHELS